MKKKIDFPWDAQAAAEENARKALPQVAREFFSAGSRAAEPNSTPELMHAFRLAAKRFRYTLEIFRPLYGPAMKNRIEQVRGVQSLLGDLQDYVASAALIRSLYPRPRPPLTATLAGMGRQAKARQEEFRRAWIERFGAAGTEEKWLDYLARYAGRKVTRP